MPINKDLSVSPFFDDFSEDKNYYKVLFKPGVSVQVRELNQLQTILQSQIEKFGNNIYKRGTIIDGVNFVYHPEYAYVKINDSQLDGIPAVPATYVTNFAVDPTTNLTAHIINSADGFESTTPNLKTMYIRYINSGTTGTETAFAAGATLKIYDYLDSINKVTIDNGSSGFSNNDTVIFCSALAVANLTSTAFTVGETISQTGNTNFAIITAVETVKGKKVLKLRPRQTDLTNTAISATTWQFTPGLDVIGVTSGATATILESIGTGAAATLTTSADIGKITEVDVTARGEGYYVAPYVSIKSSGIASAIGARNYNDLGLTGRNFVAQVTVSTGAGSVGSGYAFGVTEGVIYQKGYFVRVQPQTILVSKYTNTPDQLAIGFETQESIVDSNSDQDLLDNSTGTRNQFAPGADRLQLEPKLIVLDTEAASANDEFLSIVEFSEGYPYRENKRTQFNSIMDEMAVRTNEQSGDFVLNQFLVTTRSTANQSNEGRSFAVVTDPGRGYINGYRVETKANYSVNTDKGVDSRSAVNLSATIDYGNHILITQVGGTFNCNVGDRVNLLNLARGYASNTTLVTAGTIPTSGDTTMGTARVRNFVYDSGEVGTPSAVYRLYLFEISMNTNYKLADVLGVRMQSNAGIGDTVLTFDATLNANKCKLFDTDSGSSLIVDTGADSTKNLTNLTYAYRTTADNVDVANNGTTSILLTVAEEYFAYSSTSLTDNEKKSVVIVPTSNNIILTANTTSDGTASVSTSSNTVTLASAAVNQYNIGDYIALWSSSSVYVMRRVTGKTATTLQVDSNASFTSGTAAFSRAFPKMIPIALDRVASVVDVTGGGKTLAINFGLTHYAASAVTCSVTYDVEVRGATAQSKTADRDNFVKFNLSTGGLTGPWCLGIPDAFRLKKVYLGNSSSVNTASTDVTDQFFIDHNQNADYYNLSYLYKRNDANIKLTSATWLLVQFDAFTASPGVYTINSYVSANTVQRFADDSLTLAALGTKTNSFEIPELNTSTGKYYDLINCIDFRPVATPTASYAKTAAAANVNPDSTVDFSGSNKKFPLPESGVSFDREYFMGRKDVVVIATDNKIKIVRGVPSDTSVFPEPKVPNNTLVLNKLIIPSYPCVPQHFSAATFAILDRKMSNERQLLKRIRDKTIKAEATEYDITIDQPKVFTMGDINKLERRLQDLEYTVALSLVESDLKEKIIPSAVSPTINRFKFGFFVDDYTTKKNSDIDNIEYQADVIDSRVVPITESTLTTHGKGFRIGGYESEFAIINQDLASEVLAPIVVPPPPPEQPPVVVEPPSSQSPPPSPTEPTPPPVVAPPSSAQPPAPPPPAPVAVITAKNVTMFRSYRGGFTVSNINSGWMEFSSVASTFKVNYNFFGARDRLRIVKAGPPTGLTNTTTTSTSGTVLFDGNIKNVGVLSFTHDPSTGRSYHFTVVPDSNKWEYTLTYPIDDISYVEPTPPSTNVNTTFYTGTLVSISPGFVSPQSLSQNFGAMAYVSQGDVQSIKMAALKPSTLHTIRVSDSSSGVSVEPQVSIGTGSSVIGSTISTDAYGVLDFNMLVDTAIMSSIDSLTGNAVGGIPSTLLVTVASTDSMSAGAFYIGPKPVIAETSSAPTASYGSSTVVASPYNRIGRELGTFDPIQ